VSRNRLFGREVWGPSREVLAAQPRAAFVVVPLPLPGVVPVVTWQHQVYALAYEQAAREVARAARLRRCYAVSVN
jgi:hypothetical protein